MSEIKDVCTAMLDEPEPPMADGDAALAAVRGATRRRAARRLVGGGAGMAGLAAAALIVPGLIAGPTGVGASARPEDSTASAGRIPDMVAAAQTTLPDLPTATETQGHHDEIYRILLAAVPAGYQAKQRSSDWYIDRDDEVGQLDPERASYSSMATLRLGKDGREGKLAAHVWGDGRPAPTGDLCSAEVDARMDPIFGAAGSCEEITVGGLPMRVTTHDDPEELRVIHATWFVRNGFVSVSSQQGIARYVPDRERPADAPKKGGGLPEYHPPLERPLFTPRQVADIAGNPDLLP